MIVRLRQYEVYLRLCTGVLPLVAFVFANMFLAIRGERASFLSIEYWPVFAITTLTWWLMASHYGLCKLEKLFRWRTSATATTLAVASTYALLGFSMFLLKQFRVSRGFVVLSGCILGGITLLTRQGIRVAISKSAGRKPPVRLLMVGADQYARRAVRRISSSGFGACRVVGYVRVPGQQVAVHDAVVHEFENLENVDPTQIDDVLIAVPLEQAREVQRAMGSVKRLCRPVRAIVDIGADLTIREKLYQFGRLQMLDIGVPSVDSVQYRVGKRIFDVAFATVALISAVPLIAAIAIAVKLTSPGPVLFRQERVGLNGKLFSMLKFRSMRMAPVNESDMVWTTEDDPRRTAFGTFLRKTSLDELPQFWNVLRGDMSVVGPRPERPHFVSKFGSVVDRYNYRHLGKVGITGWAQVNGLRGDTSIERRVQYDLEYLQNWSLMFDLRIVWLTIWSGMFGKNAY